MMTPFSLPARWSVFRDDCCRSTSKIHACKFRSSNNSIILNCDQIKKSILKTGVINDCIIFHHTELLHIGVIEIKGRNYPIRHTLDQLYAGANIVRQILAESQITADYQIYLIIVAPSHPGSSVRMRSLKQKSTKATRYRLITTRCNDTFSNARKPRSRR